MNDRFRLDPTFAGADVNGELWSVFDGTPPDASTFDDGALAIFSCARLDNGRSVTTSFGTPPGDERMNDAHNVTETDLAVAAAIYPVLVECARQSPAERLTYGEFIKRAQSRFPAIDAIQKAIPVSLGRRLDVVRLFLVKKQLPDLTALVVNAGTGEVGSAFGADPERVRASVGAFDWSGVAEEFDLHVAGLRAVTSARRANQGLNKPKIDVATAKQLMHAYYRDNRASLPTNIVEKRQSIIDLIRSGIPVAIAFAEAASASPKSL